MNFEQQLLNKHILIIDDDKILNSSIRDILTAYGFSNLTSSYDIESSLDMIETEQFDLFLLDIMLPDGDGYTLAKHIRKKGDTPILFLTAKNNPEDEVAGFNAGGDDYVMKPFIPKNLIYRIMALLRRSYKSEQEAIQIGQTLVSFRNATVQKNGAEISITPIEIQILKKLYDNKNYIVSTESLCDTIWGVDSFGYENTLTVHIRKIREKIEENPSKPQYLKTAKGLGYKLLS